MIDCPNCGKDVDNLETHNKQFHDALECYAEERSKSEIQKEIDKLQNFINIASFENPLNVGDDKEKISALQVELANATEGFTEQCFDWEGHEIDCKTGEVIGDGYSKSKAYQKFLNEGENEGHGVVRDQGEIIQKDVVDVEQKAEELEHQEDKPEMSQKDWEEDLTGLKEEYATEEDEDDNLVIDNDEDLFALHKAIMDKPITEADTDDSKCENCGDLEDLNDDRLCDYCHQEAGIDRKESERDAYEVDETETSDDGTDVNTPVIPDVDNTDTDDTTINDRNQYPAEFSTETWDKKTTFNTKVQAFEGIGLTQGDALKLAELNWRELSIEVRGALNEFADDEKEEKREDIQDAFNDEGAGVGADQPDTTIEDLDEIDYNIIGDNPIAVEKYQCENCNSGFKSNEALMIHYNDLHVPAREFMLDVPNTCTYCGQEIPANVSMGEHLAYEHGISLDVKLENGQVEDGYEGGQGSGPHASLPEQAGRDPALHYDPYEKERDPLQTDPSLYQLKDSEVDQGGWDECQDCDFIGNTTANTEKHKQETGHNTEHFGLKPAVAGNEVLKKKIISTEVERCPECDTPFEDKATLEQHKDMYKHGEGWKPYVYKATEAVSYEEFKEDEHPREDSGKFTSGGSGATKQKEKPKGDAKSKKSFDKAKARAMKGMTKPEADDTYQLNKYNAINNLDGFPTHSSQLRGAGVSVKAPLMKAHLQSVYPDNKWSVRTEYFSMGSAIDGHWKGGGKYPYGASSEIAELYSNRGASNMQVDYSDTDNYVNLYDGRATYFGGDGNNDPRDPQTLANSRQERLQQWIISDLGNLDYDSRINWSVGASKDLVEKGEFGTWEGMTDEHKAQIKKTWGEFQEQEKKEGGAGEKPEDSTPKATTPAFHTQQYMGEDPDKPSEIPIDPKTHEELPVSKYNPRKGEYPIQDVTKETPKDIDRAHKQMLAQRAELNKDADLDSGVSKGGQPWQRKGEAYASAFEGIGQDVSDNWDYGINKQEILDRAGVDNKWADYTWYELPKIIQDQITNTARSYEAMYGYGSATGRMSPRDAWEQGASSEAGLNPVFQEFRTLHWSEVPVDIQELWKSELEYLTVGEVKANEDTFNSYDIKGNLLSTSSDPDISGLSEDEIFNLPVWKDKEEARRLYQQLKDSEGFVTEDDPDFENDTDYQGFIDGEKKESSQYTQQGIADAMADPDYDKLDEAKANEVEPEVVGWFNGQTEFQRSTLVGDARDWDELEGWEKEIVSDQYYFEKGTKATEVECPTCHYEFDSYEEMDEHQRQDHVPDGQ